MVGTFFSGGGPLISGESLRNQRLDKCSDVLLCSLGYVFSMMADLCEESIDGMLPVKELPHVDACRAQAKTATGIGVEKHGPIVKLLPGAGPQD
jgi:hypothetical protein